MQLLLSGRWRFSMRLKSSFLGKWFLSFNRARLLRSTGIALLFAAALAFTFGSTPTWAANHTWSGTATGSFDVSANWTPNGITAGDTYIFDNTLTTALTLSLSAAVNPGGAGVNYTDNKTNNPVTLDVSSSLSQASLAGS